MTRESTYENISWHKMKEENVWNSVASVLCLYVHVCQKKKSSGLLEQEVQVALAFLCKYCEEYSDPLVEKYMLLTELVSPAPIIANLSSLSFCHLFCFLRED